MVLAKSILRKQREAIAAKEKALEGQKRRGRKTNCGQDCRRSGCRDLLWAGGGRGVRDAIKL